MMDFSYNQGTRKTKFKEKVMSVVKSAIGEEDDDESVVSRGSDLAHELLVQQPKTIKELEDIYVNRHRYLNQKRAEKKQKENNMKQDYDPEKTVEESYDITEETKSEHSPVRKVKRTYNAPIFILQRQLAKNEGSSRATSKRRMLRSRTDPT